MASSASEAEAERARRLDERGRGRWWGGGTNDDKNATTDSTPSLSKLLNVEQVDKSLKPELVFTVQREIELPDLAEAYHGTEIRVHGVPAQRPLPEMANMPILVVCPDFPTSSAAGGAADLPIPRLPVVQYRYDTQRDLTSILEAHFTKALQEKAPKYFMTPLTNQRSRTPNFDQVVLRLATSDRQLENVSFFLFEKNLIRSEGNGGSVVDKTFMFVQEVAMCAAAVSVTVVLGAGDQCLSHPRRPRTSTWSQITVTRSTT